MFSKPLYLLLFFLSRIASLQRYEYSSQLEGSSHSSLGHTEGTMCSEDLSSTNIYQGAQRGLPSHCVPEPAP